MKCVNIFLQCIDKNLIANNYTSRFVHSVCGRQHRNRRARAGGQRPEKHLVVLPYVKGDDRKDHSRPETACSDGYKVRQEF